MAHVLDPDLRSSLVAELTTVGWALVEGEEDTWPILETLLPVVTEDVGRDISYERGSTSWVLAVHQPPEPPPAPKRQSTRMRKLVCEVDGYTVRTTGKWIAVGLPSCPAGHPLTPA